MNVAEVKTFQHTMIDPDSELLASELMQRSIAAWLETKLPSALDRSGAGLLSAAARIAFRTGLEFDQIHQDATLSYHNVTLTAAFKHNQRLFRDLALQLEEDLNCSKGDARNLGLGIMHLLAKQHFWMIVPLAETLPFTSERFFERTASGSPTLSTSATEAIAIATSSMSRIKATVGCPALKATCSLPNGRTSTVLGRYLLWVAEVSRRCEEITMQINEREQR